MLTIEKKSVKVGKLVDTQHVDTVVKNYKKERWLHNCKHIGQEDSLNAWLSIEEIEEFLALAKTHGGDGIRLYFGVYDKDFAEQPQYAGKQTLVLVATEQKELNGGKTMDKDIYIPTENGTSILAYNMVKIEPPVSGDGDWPFIGLALLDKGEEGMFIG